jgi:hypothetical protein
MGGIGMIVFGALISLYAFKVIPISKNPEKSAEWEKWWSKYGTFLKIAGPSLVVIGILYSVI